MNALAAIAIVGLAAANQTVSITETALEATPDLVNTHRGYMHYLAEHPKLQQAEQAWWNLMAQPKVLTLMNQFDEAMLRDPEAQVRFHQYYDLIAREPTLRQAVEMLQRTEFSQKGRIAKELRNPLSQTPSLMSALDYLRAHPDQAMRFFDNPRQLAPTPDSLYPFLEYFQAQPELLREMMKRFEGVLDNPLSHTKVVPWWKTIIAFDQRSGGAYTALARHFMQKPHHFWIWHQRHLALAEDAHARTWITWWHRKIRRTPKLQTYYLSYLRKINSNPERADAAEARWAKDHPERPDWPPLAAPPALQGLTPPKPPANAPGPVTPTIQSPTLTPPNKPAIQKPNMPQMPTAPNRPVKPVKPPKPEKPPMPKTPLEQPAN